MSQMQQMQKYLSKLPTDDLIKIAEAAEAKYKRAVLDSKEKLNPRLLRALRNEIRDLKKGG